MARKKIAERSKRKIPPLTPEQFAREASRDVVGAVNHLDWMLAEREWRSSPDERIRRLIKDEYRKDFSLEEEALLAAEDLAAMRDSAAVRVGYRIGIAVMRHVLTGGVR
jgi:hypothetical protein